MGRDCSPHRRSRRSPHFQPQDAALGEAMPPSNRSCARLRRRVWTADMARDPTSPSTRFFIHKSRSQLNLHVQCRAIHFWVRSPSKSARPLTLPPHCAKCGGLCPNSHRCTGNREAHCAQIQRQGPGLPPAALSMNLYVLTSNSSVHLQ